MEIRDFKPNIEKITERSLLPQFGKGISSNIIPNSKPYPSFQTVSTSLSKSVVSNTGDIYVFKPRNRNIGAFSSIASYGPRSTMTSVRITNIPLEITSKELEMIIMKECKLPVIETRIIYTTGSDNKKKSRGFAFITLSSAQNAEKVIQRLRGFKIDLYVIHAELAEAL
ncbi:hypothetical protein CWI38_1217p0030 [Hamiltosporidium tvaerminnensis]|uniref:RRM domain-containing protein n=2 Tax=Hamiltosporidium TaxID=1176354 RepID=A0A4Q9LMZ7_9MICR|nr:hypothetical protein LUQ84_000850 [Hamiltosporidium tvaerminnensis]TBT98338.1 hypothetical protein CWI36_2432p0010 [Hamiltosporidium magnivora]TBU04914.1 hypothetical protein CWI37_0072p0010 [Hamiltosporidium tvaerminnensis]TBU08620.1 hypothetical protein CWI39_0158p0020 [Hamiltosporidium magnivora]TBU11419.1 hypothetical protein CWI38_1217p0030 [Hamiltosporidium tvaerminnensis]